MNDFTRYIKALFGGRYKVIPWRSLVLLLYIISPIDFLPEALLPLIGIADDVAALGLLIASLKSDVKKFLEWERGTTAAAEVVDAQFEDVAKEEKVVRGELKR